MTKLNHTILVVDDDEDLREVICGVLEDAGYDAASAGNGREALDFLRSSPSAVPGALGPHDCR